MAFANYNRSIADVLRDVIAQFTTLLRKETELARVELSENVNRAALEGATPAPAAGGTASRPRSRRRG